MLSEISVSAIKERAAKEFELLRATEDYAGYSNKAVRDFATEDILYDLAYDEAKHIAGKEKAGDMAQKVVDQWRYDGASLTKITKDWKDKIEKLEKETKKMRRNTYDNTRVERPEAVTTGLAGMIGKTISINNSVKNHVNKKPEYDITVNIKRNTAPKPPNIMPRLPGQRRRK